MINKAILTEEIKYFGQVAAARRKLTKDPNTSEADLADHFAVISAMEHAIARNTRIIRRCVKR